MKIKWMIPLPLLIIGLISLCWGEFSQKENNDAQILPIQVVHGLPLVNVTVEGHELQLILDLGSHSSSLSKEVMENIRLIETDKTIHSIDIYGSKSKDRLFSSSQIFIGNYFIPYLEFTQSSSFNADFERETPKVLTYGKIGREPFLNHILFIDRKEGLCMVDQASPNQKVDPTKYKPGKWIEANFKLDPATGIQMLLSIDSGKEQEFILDTGANLSLLHAQASSTTPINLNNETKKLSIKLSPDTTLGTFSFYPFDLTNAGLQGILGFDFFDRYIVCIDFLNKKIFLKSYE